MTVDADDPVVLRHPELIVRRESYIELKRRGGHCAALKEDEDGRVRCEIYADRPSCCRDHGRSEQHCLTARRRAGMSL